MSKRLGLGSESLHRWVLRRGPRPPTPLIVAFIDEQRAKHRAVEAICQVLREPGVQVAARTYRAWKRAEPSVRARTDAVIIDALLATVGTPEGCMGGGR